jgi:hypothetical protein
MANANGEVILDARIPRQAVELVLAESVLGTSS